MTPRYFDKLTPDEVRDGLRRILGSREFHGSEKRRRFLSFVVEETLAGRADQLKGFTIAVAVFGRGKHFDSAHDPIVRIQAGKLRRELERYYLVAGGDDPIRIDIPKGGYVPSFVRLAQPTSAVGGKESTDRALGAGTPPSVIVMPLENLTRDTEQAFFLEGLITELTMELTRYQDIVAIPCGSGGAVSGNSTDMKDVGATLGARFLLGGSLRKDAERAKIILHLTDTATERQVWSHAYSHRLDVGEVIATQELIARDVVGTIAGQTGIISQRLSRESRKKKPADLTTYEAILRYHHYMQAMTAVSHEDVLAPLWAAVKREPGYGPAWSALANLHNHAYIWDMPDFTNPLETAVEYSRKGVLLDPGNQLTRTIMAYVHLLVGELEEAKAEADIALSLNPNSPYFVGAVGYVLVMAGDFERGRRLVNEAITLNPCHPRWFHHACWLDEYRRGEYERAYQEACMAGLEVGFWRPILCAASSGQLGREAEAKEHIEELRRIKPDFESRAGELIDRISKAEGIAGLLVDGLQKAGLKIK
jgi:TolB-like protein